MLKKIFLIYSFVFGIMFNMPNISFAQSTPHLCQNPKYYGLLNDEINVSNKEFYCWEIKYLKEYQKRLSFDMNSYLALYPQPLFVKDINILRQAGITPEKAEYLYRYFIDTPIPENLSDKKILDTALNRAEKHLKSLLPYRIGIPLGKLGGLMNFNIFAKKTTYSPIFKVFAFNDCIPTISNISFEKFVNQTYPKALAPIGVLGTTFINMFGEVVAEVKNKESKGITIPFLNIGTAGIYIFDTDIKVGSWNSSSCKLKSLPYDFKTSKSCISCHIFEITFNTVSRIGYVLYDNLSRYAIDLMVGLFLFWMLFVFFDNVIKKQDGMGFIKTFFTKSVWVFIVGVALTISITDKHNILNYTIRPLTDFMVGYNSVLTSGIENNNQQFTCKYKTKNISDNKVIFSKEIKENIVCTIERISAFNNMNFDIGKYNLQTGWRQLINFDSSGFTKLIIGFCIMAIFFYINIMVPFYFVEAFFMIAIVVFLFPLILVAYALDKKQFVKQSFDTFLSAIFQIISLTLMCSVISVLMLYISGLDFYNFQDALEKLDIQEITSEVLYMISFSPNSLLEVFYTGFISWFLLGKALSIANSFKGISSEKKIANTFFKWTQNIVKLTTTVGREAIKLKFDTSVLAKDMKDKIKEKKEILKMADERKKQKQEETKEDKNA